MNADCDWIASAKSNSWVFTGLNGVEFLSREAEVDMELTGIDELPSAGQRPQLSQDERAALRRSSRREQ